MQLVYELGDARRPRGHAFVYFRSRFNPDQVLASYLIVPPIVFDLTKYVPPMFAGTLNLPGVDLSQLTKAVPLPPVPEAMASYDSLRRLAETRGDDLIAGGDVNPGAPDQLMMAVMEAAETYSEAYHAAADRVPLADAAPPSLNVDEVLYELMTETDRLQELVKLVGKLRYGLETSDPDVATEAAGQIGTIGRFLPESYRIDHLLAAARRRSAVGARLSDLYIQRAYKLHHQNYADLIDIEDQIRQLEAQAAHE